jgi:hypothetical protein
VAIADTPTIRKERLMRRRLAFGVVLLAGLGLAVTTSAGKVPVPKEIPVTVIIADGSGYAIQSDGGDAYIHGRDGVSAVIISSGTGNLALKTHDVNSTLVRMLSLDFSNCASGPCNPPYASGTDMAFVSTSGCQNTGGLRDMPQGSSQLCSLNVNSVSEGKNWFVRFGEYSGTTPASVKRLAAGTWTIEVGGPAVAKLLSAPIKGRLVMTDEGNFFMPVQLTVDTLP